MSSVIVGAKELPKICYSTTGSLVAATYDWVFTDPDTGIMLGRMLLECYSS